MGTYCFGIDVGGTTVKCGLFRTDGTLVEKWEIPTRKENNGDQILPDVAAAVNAKMEEKGISKEEVEGVGIGVPGPVNSKGEVSRAVNLFWGYKNEGCCSRLLRCDHGHTWNRCRRWYHC